MISTETFYWICRARVFVPLEQELGQNETSPSMFSGCVTTYLPVVDCPIQKHGFIMVRRFLSFEPKLTMSFHFSILFLISRLSVAGWVLSWAVVAFINTTKPPFLIYRFVAKQTEWVCRWPLSQHRHLDQVILTLLYIEKGKRVEHWHSVMKNGRRLCLWLYSNGQ